MAKLLITATHGYDNSTRAAMPFFVAKGAKEAGIDVGLALALDATVLVKPELRKHIQPYGQPPLEELFQFMVDHRVPVYV
jgi:predicted peroxiredoxin